VRGFTSLAEQLHPSDVAAQLNRFYEVATKAIFRYDGTLDKLVGDQVMAFLARPYSAKIILKERLRRPEKSCARS
jgi:adenylate cyclase